MAAGAAPASTAATTALVVDREMVHKKGVGIICLQIENRCRLPNRLHGNDPLPAQGLPVPGNDLISGMERLQSLESAVPNVKRMIRRDAKHLPVRF